MINKEEKHEVTTIYAPWKITLDGEVPELRVSIYRQPNFLPAIRVIVPEYLDRPESSVRLRYAEDLKTLAEVAREAYLDITGGNDD